MPRPIRIKYTIPVGAQFGAPRGNGTRIHQGCDYHCPIGTPIYGTAAGGKVSYIGYNGDPITGSGNNVVIRYPDGRITTDMHLRERTPLHVGSPVDADTIVGYVGITGNAVNADPPGSHDHHQMTLNGKLINPESFYGTETASLDLTKIEEEDDMTAIRVRAENGSIAWATIGTSFFWELPNPAYETLLDGWKLWDRTKDLGVPDNIYGFLKAAAANARGTVDTASIVAGVVAAITASGGTVDAAAVAAAVDKGLADNFAAIPKAVLDAAVAQLSK